ncbi:MAG TPA: hypothetical protein VGP15_00975, partial [Burkholderiales bacterium]|nr:hypothetical protein [Burkholderiales bacterium]
MNLSLRDDTIFGHGRATLLLAAAAWIGLTTGAYAQDMSFDLNEAESAPAEEKQAPPPAEGEGEAGGEAKASGSASSSGDILADLTAEGGKEEQTADERLPREKEVIEKIYAVQRMYVLRTGRFE